ncbi:40S ribosomal protein S2 [Fusarium oxysporum f. sp. albedinis]|jgi:hypothetical protein|nr:40S ribosomal protein S2 [Fusarium oxysporum f. sp. albedinis]
MGNNGRLLYLRKTTEGLFDNYREDCINLKHDPIETNKQHKLSRSSVLANNNNKQIKQDKHLSDDGNSKN